MMKMYLYLDAHRPDFFHRFYSADMVSGVRFHVSEKAEVLVYPSNGIYPICNDDKNDQTGIFFPSQTVD
jgi:hypothetical protein